MHFYPLIIKKWIFLYLSPDVSKKYHGKTILLSKTCFFTTERKDSLEKHLTQKGSCLLCAYSQLSHSHTGASFNIHDLTRLRLPLTSMYFVNMTQKHSNIFIWEIRENLQKLILSR